MLKKRLIPKFLLRDGGSSSMSRFFENERVAGNPVTTAKVYNDYGVDELIVLDIVPSEAVARGRVVDIIERMSEEIFMPFTVGGGVRRSTTSTGCCARAPTRFRSTPKRCGARSLSARLRVLWRPVYYRLDRLQDDQPHHASVFIDGGREHVALDPVEWALRCEDFHCGEILLGSIDRDGTMDGYDLDMIGKVARR